MKRLVLIAIVVLGTMVLMGQTYQPVSYQGTNAAPNGVSLRVYSAGNGETPVVLVSASKGEPISLRVSIGFDGKEMWSTTDVDTVNVLAAGAAQNSWSYSFDDWDSVRAFDGDDIYIYAWTYGAISGEDSYADTLTIDLPGTIVHKVIASATLDTTAAKLTSTLLADYLSNAAGYLKWGNQANDEDVPAVFASVGNSDKDNSSIYSANGLRYGDVVDFDDLLTGTGNTYYILAYCPFEDVLPADATVLDARFNVNAVASVYQSKSDSLLAILMTNVGDSLWFTSDGINADTNYAHCSWNWQIQGTLAEADSATLANRGYPETHEGNWDFDSRTEVWDFGKVFQWTSEQSPTNGYANDPGNQRWDAQDWYGWRLNRLVQAAVDGETNNGFLFTFTTDGSKSYVDQYGPHNPVGAADDFLPFWTVSYITGATVDRPMPAGPNGDPALAVAVFTSDDGRLVANNAWAEKADSMGIMFTADIQGPYVGLDASYLDVADITALRDAGAVEIANHGRIGNNMATYDTLGIAAALASPATVYPDSCVAPIDTSSFTYQTRDISSCWMYELFGEEYRNDPYMGKTWSINLGVTTWPALYAANKVGLLIARGTAPGFGTTAGGWFYHGAPLFVPNDATSNTETDTIYTFADTHDLLNPYNKMGVRNTLLSNEIVGAYDTTWSEADIRKATRGKLASLIATHQPVFMWYAHDQKADSLYQDSGSIDAREWVIVMDELKQNNVTIWPMRDYAVWRRSLLIPAATPDAYGNWAAWKSTKSNGIWARMKWLDATQIQGIKRLGS